MPSMAGRRPLRHQDLNVAPDGRIGVRASPSTAPTVRTSRLPGTSGNTTSRPTLHRAITSDIIEGKARTSRFLSTGGASCSLTRQRQAKAILLDEEGAVRGRHQPQRGSAAHSADGTDIHQITFSEQRSV
jgi:hypothetical protein